MHKFFTFSEIFTTFVPVDTNKETLLNFVENFWYFCKLSRQRIDILIKSFISKSKLSTYLSTFPSNNRSSFLRSIDFSHLRNGRTLSLWTFDGWRVRGATTTYKHWDCEIVNNNNFINTENVRLWTVKPWQKVFFSVTTITTPAPRLGQESQYSGSPWRTSFHTGSIGALAKLRI